MHMGFVLFCFLILKKKKKPKQEKKKKVIYSEPSTGDRGPGTQIQATPDGAREP